MCFLMLIFRRHQFAWDEGVGSAPYVQQCAAAGVLESRCLFTPLPQNSPSCWSSFTFVAGQTFPGPCTVYGVQLTVYSLQCTVYGVQFTVYSLRCTVYSVQLTVYSLRCTFYSVQFTVYSLQCTC